VCRGSKREWWRRRKKGLRNEIERRSNRNSKQESLAQPSHTRSAHSPRHLPHKKAQSAPHCTSSNRTHQKNSASPLHHLSSPPSRPQTPIFSLVQFTSSKSAFANAAVVSSTSNDSTKSGTSSSSSSAAPPACGIAPTPAPAPPRAACDCWIA